MAGASRGRVLELNRSVHWLALNLKSMFTNQPTPTHPPTHTHVHTVHTHSVRCNQPDKIHFLLDAGALGIVCPLINTPQVSRSVSQSVNQ
jgi:hypothetical protein